MPNNTLKAEEALLLLPPRVSLLCMCQQGEIAAMTWCPDILIAKQVLLRH